MWVFFQVQEGITKRFESGVTVSAVCAKGFQPVGEKGLGGDMSEPRDQGTLAQIP